LKRKLAHAPGLGPLQFLKNGSTASEKADDNGDDDPYNVQT
jgi:hypothetical protein